MSDDVKAINAPAPVGFKPPAKLFFDPVTKYYRVVDAETGDPLLHLHMGGESGTKMVVAAINAIAYKAYQAGLRATYAEYMMLNGLVIEGKEGALDIRIPEDLKDEIWTAADQDHYVKTGRLEKAPQETEPQDDEGEDND